MAHTLDCCAPAVQTPTPRTLYVNCAASSPGNGSAETPFRTIQQAADIALPGDTVLVAPGSYHENVNPKHAGRPDARITYRATERGKAVITAAERVTTWKSEGDGVWSVRIPNAMFGSFNPYTALIQGDWLDATVHAHRGQVFLNDTALYEVNSLDDVKEPKDNPSWDQSFVSYTWYTTQDAAADQTIIYANFHDVDPNEQIAEISVRPECFMPQETGIGWITLDGFTITKAASQWAPPTAYQDGMVGPHWSKGWIIENCEISHARCAGISLGKKLQPDNENKWLFGKVKDGTQTQRECAVEASYDDWDREHVGSHIIRNNYIHDCGQAGIVGHMGCVFSVIENNDIERVNIRRDVGGAEVGGIKLHAAIDVIIRHNHIHHNSRGLWLDWQAQGTRVTGNVFDHNSWPGIDSSWSDDKLKSQLGALNEDIFVEVSHGPTLIDNNLLLSQRSVKICSQGLALVHNLIAGSLAAVGRGTDNGAQKLPSARFTPYHVPHSTQIEGFMTILHGDVRILNNVFVSLPQRECLQRLKDELGWPVPFEQNQWDDCNIDVGTFPYSGYPSVEEWKSWFDGYCGMGSSQPADRYYQHLPVRAEGNVFLGGARPSDLDRNDVCGSDPVSLTLEHDQANGSWHLSGNVAQRIEEAEKSTSASSSAAAESDVAESPLRSCVSTGSLGKAFEPEERFENPDGTPIDFTTDILGRQRTGTQVQAGPFASLDDFGKAVFADLPQESSSEK